MEPKKLALVPEKVEMYMCFVPYFGQFSRQNTRWPTFRYAIMLGIWMGRSLIYKQRSAKSWFHTKLILNENSDDPSGLSVRWVRERWSTHGYQKKTRRPSVRFMWMKTVSCRSSRVECLWKSVGVLADFTRKGRRRRYFWEADSCCSVIDKEGRWKNNIKKQTRKEDREKEKLLSEERFTTTTMN